MSVLVIIPTYNERDNVKQVVQRVFKAYPRANILFVDDNSPDGTGQIIDVMVERFCFVHVIHRTSKKGLGRAYIAGFKWALEHGYDLILEMDCDLQHDSAEIPNFLKAAQEADLVLGSRYMGGKTRVTNWPLGRLMLSKAAAWYVKTITRMPTTDPTGGFKCYRRSVLEAIDLDSIVSNGYSFQIEMTHAAWTHGFRIKEIPITFGGRMRGQSKMSMAIWWEAIAVVWRLLLGRFIGNTPLTNEEK